METVHLDTNLILQQQPHWLGYLLHVAKKRISVRNYTLH